MVDDEAPMGALVDALKSVTESLDTVREELVVKVADQAAEIKTLNEKVEKMEGQIFDLENAVRALENDDPWGGITKQFADRIEEIQDILRKDGHWLQHVRRAGDSW